MVYRRFVVVALLGVQASMLAWSAECHSPTFNEIGHVPAGISHWQYQMFHLYRVNPPLPRMAAVAPLLYLNPKTDWHNYSQSPFARDAVIPGIDFAEANGADVFRLFTIARWACIPFALLGGWVCYRWAFELWGSSGGLLSLALWCFNPYVLGHGALVMPDVPAAAVGAAASYLFWHWLKDPSWHRVIAVGTVLGLAQLCKTTLLLLLIVWPVCWLIYAVSRQDSPHVRRWRSQGMMLCVIFTIALLVLNLGYGFAGLFQRLGDFQFQSELLSGQPHDAREKSENRFSNTLLAALPVPVPKDYLQGIDRQQTDFELGSRSYLRGQWQERGWWYYYLYALAIKIPLGTWVLFLLAVGVSLAARGYSASWRDEAVLLLPAAAILLLVSSQTGFSVHSRYVLPMLPFVFIWSGKVGRCVQLRHWMPAAVAGAALCWSVGGSLCYYPHSLSYFNELVGGPQNGHYHLLDSNIAWGQDLLFLRRWMDVHPEARPIGLASYGWIHPELAGIDFTLPPLGPRNAEDAVLAANPENIGPLPGWHAIDVNFLHGTHWAAAGPNKHWTDIPINGLNYEYFLHFQPTAMAGYSIYIYHITLDEANRVRKILGLPELREDTNTQQPTWEDET